MRFLAPLFVVFFQAVTYIPMKGQDAFLRIQYGLDSLQFGDLRLPDGEGPFPVIVIIHGGCWLNQYDYTLMNAMAEDLTQRGYVTWNLEYRRIGDPGGGWPGTFLDIADGFRFIDQLSKDYPLDLNRVLVTGHSAGGHLALWLGAYNSLPESSELAGERIPGIQGIVSLAGITDLEAYRSPSGCGASVDQLMGGLPASFNERYREASPIHLLPNYVPTFLINGEEDSIVPVSHVKPYFDEAVVKEGAVELVLVPEAGHFEVIRPGSIAWTSIINAFEALIK